MLSNFRVCVLPSTEMLRLPVEEFKRIEIAFGPGAFHSLPLAASGAQT